MEKRRAFVLTANFLLFSAYRDLLPENVFQMQICFLLSNLTMMLNSVHPLWLYLKEQILRENQGKLSRIALIDTPKIVYNSSSKGNALEIQGGWSSTAPEGSACSIHDFLFVELFRSAAMCVIYGIRLCDVLGETSTWAKPLFTGCAFDSEFK